MSTGLTHVGAKTCDISATLWDKSAFLYGFDLLELDGEDLRRHSWEIRRATLTRLLRKAGPGVRLSEHLDDSMAGGGIPPGAKERQYRLRHQINKGRPTAAMLVNQRSFCV